MFSLGDGNLPIDDYWGLQSGRKILNKSFQEYLSLSEYVRHLEMNSCILGDIGCLPSFRILVMGILFRAWISQFSSLALQGVIPNNIQNMITPKDQTSHLVVQDCLSNSCGAMQIGLPTQLFNICPPKLSTYLANPKSAILNTPSWNRMLAGFRSLWTTFLATNSLKPLTICLTTQKASSQLNLFFFMISLRSPPLQYSVMMYRLFLELKTSLNLTMLRWSNRLSRYISEKMAFSRYLSFIRDERSIFLMATFSLDSFSMPSQTLPQTPSPKQCPDWQEQFPMTLISTSFIPTVCLLSMQIKSQSALDLEIRVVHNLHFMRLKLKADVIVVGCGPVGLMASLLLQKLNINYIALDKSESLRQHPSAHWINTRSKQIFSEVPSLVQRVEDQQEDWKYFSHYMYVERVLGRCLGSDNHFSPSVPQKLASLRKYSKYNPSHLSQNKLAKIMEDLIDRQQNIKLGANVKGIIQNTAGGVVLACKIKNQEVSVEGKYVIACDGFHSTIRKTLGIQMKGEERLLSFINIHFESKQLAKLIDQNNQNAMLHFVYNTDFPAVLVNHSKKDGVFVLQIPNYEPFYNMLEHFSPSDLISKVVQPSFRVQDTNIINVGKWMLSSQVAETYFKGNICLAGDAAHSFPPAGGFGMNTGFQDVHNLVHKLNLLRNNTRVSKDQVFRLYDEERKRTCDKVMALANEGYSQSLQIAKSLGLNPNFLKVTKHLGGVPFNKQLFSAGMKLLFKPRPINNHIRLFYQQEELSLQRLSKHRALFQSVPSNISFVRDPSLSGLCPQLLGIEDVNTMVRPLGDQKLIRSDGLLIR